MIGCINKAVVAKKVATATDQLQALNDLIRPYVEAANGDEGI